MMNKTSKYPQGLKASSQTQDGINLSELVTKGEKGNDSLDSTGNLSESGAQVNYHQGIITATYRGVRLQGKSVSKILLTCQDEIYLHLKFPYYPKVLNLCLQLIR